MAGGSAPTRHLGRGVDVLDRSTTIQHMLNTPALLSTWGQALDGVRGSPVMPSHLTTHRCGRDLQRWQERRVILIRQRDMTLRRLTLGLHPEPPKANRRLNRLNAAINVCNDAIDTLEVALAHPEEKHTLDVL